MWVGSNNKVTGLMDECSTRTCLQVLHVPAPEVPKEGGVVQPPVLDYAWRIVGGM